MPSKLERQTILITGASSGLGAAIAKAFHDEGAQVIGTSRRAELPDGLAEGEITIAPLDVCDDASVARLASWMSAQNIVPDVLVLNAGNGISGAIEETDIDLAKQQFETNFFGVHRTVQAFLPAMRRRQTGRIIIVGSLAGRIAIPFQGFYSASKSAVRGYAASLRQELMGFGLQVSLVEPGDFNTGFGDARSKSEVSKETPYEPQASRAVAIMEASERAGGDPVEVGALILKVARERRPKFHYPIGNRSERLGVLLQSVLPDRLFERVIMGIYKVPRRIRSST